VRQLPLFTLGATPSRPALRWHRRIERIEVCSRCGREIIVKRTVRGTIVREYVSADGCCLSCTASR
jgi:hypothetical protein